MGDRSSDADARARLAAEIHDGEALNHAADQLEGRILETQANVHLWQEMAWRHQRVSALATQNADEHFQQMVRLFDYQQEKARKLKRPRSVAQRNTVLTHAVASRRGRRATAE